MQVGGAVVGADGLELGDEFVHAGHFLVAAEEEPGALSQVALAVQARVAQGEGGAARASWSPRHSMRRVR
ncbi:hypothetical protein ACFQ51_50085 [Streptomyces kaempferi]